MRLSGESNLLAVSAHRDEFVEVSASALQSCLHTGAQFLWHYVGVKVTLDYPCCLCSLFAARESDTMATCSLSFLSSHFRLERENSTSFVSFSNQSVSGIVTCGDKQSHFQFSGFEMETVTPGCVLTVKGVTFVSTNDPGIEEKQVVSVFKGNVSFSADMSALNSSLTAALSDFDYIDFNALVKGGGRIKEHGSMGTNLRKSMGCLDDFGSYLGCHSCFDWGHVSVQAQIVQDSCWSIDGG